MGDIKHIYVFHDYFLCPEMRLIFVFSCGNKYLCKYTDGEVLPSSDTMFCHSWPGHKDSCSRNSFTFPSDLYDLGFLLCYILCLTDLSVCALGMSLYKSWPTVPFGDVWVSAVQGVWPTSVQFPVSTDDVRDHSGTHL